MKLTFKAAGAGLATLAAVGTGLLTTMAPAFAVSPTGPAWVPDTNGNNAPYSGITFYDANGNMITSGNNLSSIAAYAVGDSHFSVTSGHNANSSSVEFALPDHNKPLSGWNVGGGTAGTSFPITSGAPADIMADTTTPVATMTGANTFNLTNYLSGVTPDTTSGYAGLIQVRQLNSGLGVTSTGYWEADLAYNQGTSAASVVVNATSGYSVTVPAGSWVQVFPLETTTTTTLVATPNAASETNNTSVALQATVSPAESGTVTFYYGTTQVGTPQAVTTSNGVANVTDASEANVGPLNYTAVFNPTVGETLATPNTATATQIGGSTSNAVPMTFGPAKITTSNTVADTTSATPVGTGYPAGSSFNLTDQVAESDSPTTAGLAGSVQFLDNGSPLGAAITTQTSGLYSDPGVTFPSNSTNVITAVFTPTNTAYSGGTSTNSVTININAPTICASPSVCSDTQNITVTVSPGSITISTPYTSSSPLNLGTMALSSDSTYLQATGTFGSTTASPTGDINVTSTLSPAYAWTLSVAMSNPLTNGTGGTIPTTDVGLSNGAWLNQTGAGAYPGTVSFTNGATGIAAAIPGPDGPGGTGLNATPQSWATSNAADGTALMDGKLTINAPTSTPNGVYTGTITFSVS